VSLAQVQKQRNAEHHAETRKAFERQIGARFERELHHAAVDDATAYAKLGVSDCVQERAERLAVEQSAVLIGLKHARIVAKANSSAQSELEIRKHTHSEFEVHAGADEVTARLEVPVRDGQAWVERPVVLGQVGTARNPGGRRTHRGDCAQTRDKRSQRKNR
jgi:hypothetical protein